jgi:uncharacterized protein
MAESMMRKFWSSTGRVLSRRTAATVAVVALISAVMGFGVRRLDFATGQNSYIDPGSKVAKDNERYQKLFGGESMVVLFTVNEGKTLVDLLTAGNVAQLREVDQQMRADPSVQTVVSPLTLLQWTNDLITKGAASNIIARTIQREPDTAAAARRQEDAVMTTRRLGAAGAQSLANPEWVKFLLFANDGFTVDANKKLVAPPDGSLVVRKALRAFIPDARHAVLAAVLVGNASLDQQATGSRLVEKVMSGRTFENAKVTITGTPTFLTDINNYLQGGMLSLGGIAAAMMVAILLVAFKVRWRLLPMLGMALGIVWGFGMFGFTGTKLSLVTITGLPILIGLGIEFAIQIQNRIEEERAIAPVGGAFERTLAHMGPPLGVATIAAVLAFLTVKISKVPMVQDFGVLLAIGIVALLAAGVVVPITLLAARERRSPSTDQPTASWVERIVDGLGRLPRKAVVLLVVIAVCLPVLGLLLESGSKIESDPINWANQSSTSIRNARLLEQETGFATTLGVFVETRSAPRNGVFTDQMGAFVVDLVARSSRENPELAEASSLATTVAWLAEVPNTSALAPTGLDMLEAFNVAPPTLQGLLVANDANAAQVLFQVGPSSLAQRAVVLDKVRAAIDDPGGGALLPATASATTGGLAVVGVGLLKNITANRAQLTIVALLLVAAFVILRTRDLARGVLTMIPVLLAVGTSATLVRSLGITLSPLTTVSGPLVVATCAEFSVLLVARYAEERDQGLDPEHSTKVAAERTGRAFFTSALTTLGGFAVLMFSSLPLISDFGIVVTINIAVALLSALVVVPPLVKAADHHGLLSMGTETSSRQLALRSRTRIGMLGGVTLGVLGVVIGLLALRTSNPATATSKSAAAIEVPATMPPPTTARPTITTTVAPAGTPSSEAPSGPAATPTTLPRGPAERPVGLVAGAFWDALVRVGVDPGVARCAADELLATTTEAELLTKGIATVPRPAEVNALLDAAAGRCGVTRAQLDAAAAAG